MSPGASACALRSEASAGSRNSAAMQQHPHLAICVAEIGVGRCPAGFRCSRSATRSARAAAPDRFRRHARDPAATTGRSASGVDASLGVASSEAQPPARQHHASRRRRMRSLHRPSPSLSVVYRSTGTSVHSSVRPPGQITRTLGDCRRIAEADEHPRIVGRRVAAVGPRPPPERATRPRRTMPTRAPSMSRARRLPDTAAAPSQCLRLPTWLISRRTGPLSLPTTTSVSPSLSMSPNAAPRLDLGQLQNTAPACR